MIWIMFYHSQIQVPQFLWPVGFVKYVGYGGVDIFFLLSGFGLSFSLTKNRSLLPYFKRRFVRILPAFWLILAFVQIKNLIIGSFSARDLILSFSGFDFFIFGNLETWFIPAIIVCYLLFPIYYYLSDKYGIIKVLIICSVAAVILSLLITGSPLQHLNIFTVRLPAFFIGACVGQLLIAGKRPYLFDNIWISFFLFVVFAVSLFLIIINTTALQRWSTGLWWYPAVLIAYPLSMVSGYVLSKTDRKCPRTLYLIRPIGIYSLELFLIHGALFSIADQLPLKNLSFNFFRVPEYIIYILTSLLASVFINKAIKKVPWLKA